MEMCWNWSNRELATREMNNPMYPAYTQNHTPQIGFTLVPRLLSTLAGALAIFVFAMGGFWLNYQYSHTGRIFPGVRIGGVDVGGLTRPEARERVAQTYPYPVTGRIGFQDGGGAWIVSPAELGLFFDLEASVEAAYQLGRAGGLSEQAAEQLRLWQEGQDLPLVTVYDERIAYQYIQRLGEIVNRPTIEADLGLTGVEVMVNSGQVGRTLDVQATLERLRPQLVSLTDGLVPLVIFETPPLILDATAQAELARQILSAPLVVRNPQPASEDQRQWEFSPETLAGMLSIERAKTDTGETYQVTISTAQLRSFLNQIAPGLKIEAQNARFIFNDDSRELEVIQPHVDGRSLLVEETIQAIQQNLFNNQHTTDLVYQVSPPAVSGDRTAADYGISELVVSNISYFYGSSAARIQNITTAASKFHGVMVAPGETFSMAELLGDVTLDNGYAEALIIYGDRTIQGVGGGVCQVSTTLFRAAFFGGYDIVERYAHAYRVSYYELNANGGVNTRLAGLDATVFVPLVDFKFTNDSPHWLLMETYVNTSARTLTWKFYSTSDGREVDWTTSGLQNKVDPPEPLYKENPELASGVIKQVDWAVEGADVSIRRVVTRDGALVHDDLFNTHYTPWRAVYEYGPGTEIPTPEE